MASQEGHTATVDTLLRNGADPNLANIVSETEYSQVTLCTTKYVVLSVDSVS